MSKIGFLVDVPEGMVPSRKYAVPFAPEFAQNAAVQAQPVIEQQAEESEFVPLDFSNLKMVSDRKANSDYMNYIYRSLKDKGMDNLHIATLLGTIANESGGDPFALSPDGKFYGLLQWADDRYKPNIFDDDPYEEINRQLDYLSDSLNNTEDRVSWTHGGDGSGYMRAVDAHDAWVNAEDLFKATHALNWGYVRPAGKDQSVQNRYKTADQIYNLMLNIPETPVNLGVPVNTMAEGGPVNKFDGTSNPTGQMSNADRKYLNGRWAAWVSGTENPFADTSSASKMRQWIYNNGYGVMLDDYYQNYMTPEQQKTVNRKFLSDNSRAYSSGIIDKTVKPSAEEIPFDPNDRLRAEMMARYSGGANGIGNANPLRVLLTRSNANIDKPVYSGDITPKKYLDNSDYKNYSGTIYYNYGTGEISLLDNDMTKNAKNDPVSSMFNEEIPLKEYGVVEKDGLEDLYTKHLFRSISKNYPQLFDNSLRVYQTNADTLAITPILDSLANLGQYKIVKEKEKHYPWRIGDNPYYYDAGQNSRIDIDYNGQRYSKNNDIFDVKGFGKGITRRYTDYITDHANPYIMTTPWYENN